MRYNFSAHFLKILPPATSFGDAWEGLCLKLLSSEYPELTLVRLAPPDRGVDILATNAGRAYQCKADERGSFGTAPAASCVESIETAAIHRATLGWNTYYFAVNANFTGAGLQKILGRATELRLDKSAVVVLGPDYWSSLCERHIHCVSELLDYRFTVSEADVLEAFRKAGYYDNRVAEYQERIRGGEYHLDLSNNRTPIRLQIPFSPLLTIEHCLDVAMQMLGVSLEPEFYPDLGTSAQVSVSITIDRVPIGFSKRLAELPAEDRSKLQLWITLVWSDKRDEARRPGIDFLERHRHTPNQPSFLEGSAIGRREQTLARFEATLQMRMWRATQKWWPSAERS